MRKSFDGLCGLVESVFEQKLLDAICFCFSIAAATGSSCFIGTAMAWSSGTSGWRLEARNAAVADEQSHVELDATQLAMLLGGVSLGTAQRRKRYAVRKLS